MIKSRTIARLLLVCWLSNALLFSSSSSANAADNAAPIKIGFLASMTGPVQHSSEGLLNGLKLYLDQIHYKMAGRPVELVAANDEASPTTARAMVKKLVETDKCQVLDGLILANLGYACASVADKYKVPFCYAVAAADDLTQRQRHNWIVRTGWSSSLCSQPFGEWVYKNLGYKRIVCFGLDYSFGWEVVGGFQKTFEDAGGKVVQKIWAPLGFTDFEHYISGIRKDADAVFILTANQAAQIFPKQYAKFGPKLPIVAGGTSYDETVLEHMGDEALGAISAHVYSPKLKTPANLKFVKAYKDKYGEEPGFFAECGYTSGMWIDSAVKAVNGKVEDKDKFLAALKKVQLTEAPRGPVKADSYGNPIENVYVRKVEKVNGKLQNTVIYTFPNVSQFWKYKPEEFLKQPVYSKDYPPCTHCTPANSPSTKLGGDSN